MKDSERIPLMYQAQIETRGKIQYAGDPEPAQKWVEQWLMGCPPQEHTRQNNNLPALRRSSTKLKVKLPQFGTGVETKKYTISWRFVTNSGQDEGIIRPVIGAKGIPFYPGSSMKGAFRRACSPKEAQKYCGGEIEVTREGNHQKETQPGELVFHGGYPVDMSWGDKERLVDVVHEQWKRQIKDNSGSSANIQISLYQPTYKFGISSTKRLTQQEWNQIWRIWEAALSQGIGSRVSAGYGQIKELQQLEIIDNEILSVYLYGEGIYSQLLNPQKTPEFRPNMFKAALRGHTIRLLAGITDENTTEELTKKLWGSLENIGQLGIRFTYDSNDLKLQKAYKRAKVSTYKLDEGNLSLISIGNLTQEKKAELTSLAKKLIQFSLLLGGFGKSWRRVDHGGFYPEYLKDNSKLPIGCHWELIEQSEKLYVTANKKDLSNISQFLQNIRHEITRWAQSQDKFTNNYVTNWREVWHPDIVQVWGRIAKNDEDSKAIKWFHGSYSSGKTIKNTTLTGKIGQTGRIWHRMYPRCIVKKGEFQVTDEYVELLTIFPDHSSTAQDFLKFLKDRTDFRLIFGTDRNN
ncbi:MAG: hypothetical protein QNJ55_22935 [Xenococcus sp. MO_188.B8]|nr:hypothetical protein [Xenococcus sp. MO_188.B8]